MHIELVDPRDTQWECVESAYRVYFWDAAQGWASDEWRITQADVGEVLAWADENANGRRTTVWVEHTFDGRLGLIRLEGWEPVRSDAAPPWVRAGD